MAQQTRARPARFWLPLAAVALLAAAMRLYHLGAPSVWIDELYTVETCANLRRAPASKVLGYLPTRFVLSVTGVSLSGVKPNRPEEWRSLGLTEARIRLASCLIGILSIPLLAVASRRLLGDRAACLTAFLLAIAPWHIEWSQAARYYSQQFLFYNLSLLWYFTATRERSLGRLAASLAVMALAFLTQPPSLVICGIFALDWGIALLRKRPVRLGRAGWMLCGGALALCLLVVGADIVTTPDNWAHLVQSQHQQPLTLLMGSAYLIGPAVGIFALVSAWWLLRRNERLALYLASAAVVPLLVFAALSYRQYVGLRYALICLYAWLALCGVGLAAFGEALRKAHGPIVAWMLVAVLAVPSLLMDAAYFTGAHGFHRRWRDAYAYISQHMREGDRVCAGPSEYALVARYYMENADIVAPFPATRADLEAMDTRVWLVFEAAGTVESGTDEAVETHWAQSGAELMTVLYIRVMAPEATVHVYLFDPNRPSDASIGVPTSRPLARQNIHPDFSYLTI